jgi:hypothetical protein
MTRGWIPYFSHRIGVQDERKEAVQLQMTELALQRRPALVFLLCFSQILLPFIRFSQQLISLFRAFEPGSSNRIILAFGLGHQAFCVLQTDLTTHSGRCCMTPSATVSTMGYHTSRPSATLMASSHSSSSKYTSAKTCLSYDLRSFAITSGRKRFHPGPARRLIVL